MWQIPISQETKAILNGESTKDHKHKGFLSTIVPPFLIIRWIMGRVKEYQLVLLAFRNVKLLKID